MKGTQTSTGPVAADLAARFLSRHVSSGPKRKILDMCDASMEEMRMPTTKMTRASVREKSVRKNRLILVDPSEMLDEDSHRPEYVTVTHANCENVSSKARGPETVCPWPEQKVHKTMWAIRRTEPGRKMTCFGILAGQTICCGRFINDTAFDIKQGVPAPSFWGRRKYPASGSKPGGVVEGFVWFCNVSNTHSWSVDEMIVAPPGPALGTWIVAEGTNLQSLEVDMLLGQWICLAQA